MAKKPRVQYPGAIYHVTGGVYSVSGTIGQPDTGTLSGGSYTLAGGFWGIVSAVQTPGAPFLSITRSNAPTGNKFYRLRKP